MIPVVFALNVEDNTDVIAQPVVPSKDTAAASKSPVILKFLALDSDVAVPALPLISPVIFPVMSPSKLVAVIIPVTLMFSGSLSLSIVPVVILAPSAKLVAVPVTSSSYVST